MNLLLLLTTVVSVALKKNGWCCVVMCFSLLLQLHILLPPQLQCPVLSCPLSVCLMERWGCPAPLRGMVPSTAGLWMDRRWTTLMPLLIIWQTPSLWKKACQEISPVLSETTSIVILSAGESHTVQVIYCLIYFVKKTLWSTISMINYIIIMIIMINDQFLSIRIYLFRNSTIHLPVFTCNSDKNVITVVWIAYRDDIC